MSDFSRIMELALAGNAAKTQEALGTPAPTDATAKPAASTPAPAPASPPPPKK